VTRPRPGGRDKDVTAEMLGPILVAKETIHQEQLLDMSFHSKMAKLHAKCQQVCESFNKRTVFLGPSHQMNYLQPVIYEVTDPFYPAGIAWILAEQRLEGKFTKWNNNVGGFRKREAFGQVKTVPAINRDLGAIREEDEDEEGPSDEQESIIDISDIPQCFSHFSWSFSDGQQLICDIQGVWNEQDGFVLTDPVIHSGGKRNGATDRGRSGIDLFFNTHQCSPLCHRLGLKQYDAKAAASAALLDLAANSPARPTLNPRPKPSREALSRGDFLF
jgi:hypothetical protein